MNEKRHSEIDSYVKANAGSGIDRPWGDDAQPGKEAGKEAKEWGAYTTTSRGEVRIGTAQFHPDGTVTVRLDALPVQGAFVIHDTSRRCTGAELAELLQTLPPLDDGFAADVMDHPALR